MKSRVNATSQFTSGPYKAKQLTLSTGYGTCCSP